MSGGKVVAAVCQRCGAGFVLTSGYRSLLERKNIRVHTPPQCPKCYFRHGTLPKTRGTVKRFDARKRYGFIDGQETRDIFHQSQVIRRDGRSLIEGQSVRFHLCRSPRGPEAFNVELSD